MSVFVFSDVSVMDGACDVFVCFRRSRSVVSRSRRSIVRCVVLCWANAAICLTPRVRRSTYKYAYRFVFFFPLYFVLFVWAERLLGWGRKLPPSHPRAHRHRSGVRYLQVRQGGVPREGGPFFSSSVSVDSFGLLWELSL